MGAIAARFLAVSAINTIHYGITGEVTKGGKYQRSANLTNAAFAVIANRGDPRATRVAGNIAVGVAAATGPPHLNGFGKKHPGGIRRL